MIILIYFTIGLFCTYLLRYKYKFGVKKSIAKVPECESKVIDGVFNFQNLPPEVRLMIYHKMDLISKLRIRPMSSLEDREFIDETWDMKPMIISATNKTRHSMSISYVKEGVRHNENYTGKNCLEVLQNICHNYLREVPTDNELYRVVITGGENVKFINVYDDDCLPFLTIATTKNRNVVKLLKCIPYSSITSDVKMDPEVFDLSRTISADLVEFTGKCTIDQFQLCDLRCKHIHLNIPRFDGSELQDYVENVTSSNQNLESFRVRTTERNTTKFVKMMMYLLSPNHRNTPSLRTLVTSRNLIKCFAGDDEQCEAAFRVSSYGKDMSVLVSKSEIVCLLKDDK